MVIARSGEVMIYDDNGRERERHKVPYGATLQVKDGDAVRAGKILAQWDATSRPIITEYAGTVKFENVEEGVTVAKQVDEVTGLSTLVVIDPKRRAGTTAKGVRPQVKLLDADGHEIHTRSVPWVHHSGQILEQVLRIDAHIATPTVMAELAFVRELGGFDERMRFTEDYDLWSRMALRSEVVVDTEPLAFVRSHGQHFTMDRAGSLRGWANLYAKMETLVPTGRLRALCRKRRRDYLLQLAAQQARAGDWPGMSEAVLAAARARACSPRGWLRVARMALSGRHARP